MSAEAIATLQRLWEKLVIMRVQRTIVREPEDVLSIDVPQIVGESDEGVTLLGHNQYSVPTRRIADIPREDRWRARIAWRHFYGFTEDGIYFDLAGYHELDFDLSATCDWSGCGNHLSGYDKRPLDGQLIAGIVVNSPKGHKLERWFILTPELKFLIDLVRDGHTELSQERLARKLLTDGFPDTLWALVRLVFFDNVQVFVDQHRGMAPAHPCHGEPYGCVQPGGRRWIVRHEGMYLSMNPPLKLVHTLASHLNSPQWWEEVQRLTTVDERHHVRHGDYCCGCEQERR